MLLQLCRIRDLKKPDTDTISFKSKKIRSNKNNVNFGGELYLFVADNEKTITQIPEESLIAGVYLSLMPNQRIELRHINKN